VAGVAVDGKAFGWRPTWRTCMADRTYKIIELVGISEESFSDAVDDAIQRADQTLEDLSWFEVIEERGSISDGSVMEYQVKVKVAFELG
jgi:flavin-binding protein dodecin